MPLEGNSFLENEILLIRMTLSSTKIVMNAAVFSYQNLHITVRCTIVCLVNKLCQAGHEDTLINTGVVVRS
jgi:hypothetical protein